MPDMIELSGEGIAQRRISVADSIGQILPRGHVIHGYSSAGGTRLLMVLESRAYSDKAPLLGFGMDGSAERALARALITYAIREERGQDYITETELPESTRGQLDFGGNVSRFDNIVWGSDFFMYQEDGEVVAGSNYGGGWGLEPMQVRAADPLAAIVRMTKEFRFVNNRVRSGLPPVSFE